MFFQSTFNLQPFGYGTAIGIRNRCYYCNHVTMRKEQKPITNFPNFFTTVFVHTRLWKTKHSRKRFQNFRQSCVLLPDRIEIHRLQPPSVTY